MESQSIAGRDRDCLQPAFSTSNFSGTPRIFNADALHIRLRLTRAI